MSPVVALTTSRRRCVVLPGERLVVGQQTKKDRCMGYRLGEGSQEHARSEVALPACFVDRNLEVGRREEADVEKN